MAKFKGVSSLTCVMPCKPTPDGIKVRISRLQFTNDILWEKKSILNSIIVIFHKYKVVFINREEYHVFTWCPILTQSVSGLPTSRCWQWLLPWFGNRLQTDLWLGWWVHNCGCDNDHARALEVPRQALFRGHRQLVLFDAPSSTSQREEHLFPWYNNNLCIRKHFQYTIFIANSILSLGTMKTSNYTGIPKELTYRDSDLSKSLKRGEYIMLHCGTQTH